MCTINGMTFRAPPCKFVKRKRKRLVFVASSTEMDAQESATRSARLQTHHRFNTLEQQLSDRARSVTSADIS